MSGYCSDTTKACQRVCLASFFDTLRSVNTSKGSRFHWEIYFGGGGFLIFNCKSRAFENFWTPPSPAPKIFKWLILHIRTEFYDRLSVNNYTTERDNFLLAPPSLSISSLCMQWIALSFVVLLWRTELGIGTNDYDLKKCNFSLIILILCLLLSGLSATSH